MWSQSFRFDTWSVWTWHNPESFFTCEWVKELIFQPYKNCSVSNIEHLGSYVCLDVGFWNVSWRSSNNALSKSDVSEDHWHLPILPRACSDRLTPTLDSHFSFTNEVLSLLAKESVLYSLHSPLVKVLFKARFLIFWNSHSDVVKFTGVRFWT